MRCFDCQLSIGTEADDINDINANVWVRVVHVHIKLSKGCQAWTNGEIGLLHPSIYPGETGEIVKQLFVPVYKTAICHLCTSVEILNSLQ